ncbi:metallophosphoesterase [Actinomyces mediterranea]|uniref:metallophosphoesterase n=1 Tax=Actinomyces mediterranea TaxID=1871028 RepID=UPI0009FAC53F|nr:metallophosphoesterase [Actinomyces mediterranea]
MTDAYLPLGLEYLADQPSIAPRGLIASGRALGIALGGFTVAGMAALAWGSVERRLPVLRHVTVTLPPEREIRDLDILHISDLHLYPGQEFIVRFLKDVASAHDIDLVVSTGDNFGAVEGLDLVKRAYEPFIHLPGVFVLGSNDYYSARKKNWGRYLIGGHKLPEPTIPDLPWTHMVKLLRDAGWLDLSNRSGTLEIPVNGAGPAQTVSFLGTDDAHINRDRITPVGDEWAAENSLRIGVTHSPYTRVINAFTSAGADLMLAGHTHGGQIGLPGFGAIVTNCDIDRAYAKGLHAWSANGHESMLHVSAGLGTSPYAPVRIATRPDATMIHIRS